MKRLVATTVLQLATPNLSHSKERTIFEALEKGIQGSCLTPSETAAVLAYARENGYDTILAKRHYDHEILAEKIQAADGHGLEDFAMHQMGAAKRHIRDELALVANRDGANLVFVGAGALPYSAILAQQELGKPVTICDIDLDALRLAETLIERLGMRDKFTFMSGAAQKIDLSAFNIIWLAAMANPKLDILSNSTLPDCASVLVRQTIGLGQLLYGSRIDFSNNSRWHQHGSSVRGNWSTYETILLQRIKDVR